MNVFGHEHIFAGGDIVSYQEEKGEYAAMTAGNLIARNICQKHLRRKLIKRGENGSPGPIKQSIQIISLGVDKGKG
jgi:NADH dehydrogenase FAD-containing subunit